MYKQFISNTMTRHYVAILAFYIRKAFICTGKKKKEPYIEIMTNFGKIRCALEDFSHWTEILERK